MFLLRPHLPSFGFVPVPIINYLLVNHVTVCSPGSLIISFVPLVLVPYKSSVLPLSSVPDKKFLMENVLMLNKSISKPNQLSKSS